MMLIVWLICLAFAAIELTAGNAGTLPQPVQPRLTTMAALKRVAKLSIAEVPDYVFGGYSGSMLPSPPHADGNPKRALIITWKEFPFRFVFAHEGSYCPWFEFPSGAGHCFQFFEGNDGWAELFNDFGRRETNSSIEVLEAGPDRVWVRWNYFGVNQQAGQRAYRCVEDFWACPNGLILRRQTVQTLMPGDHRGYAREPIEMIAMCPKGKLWSDVLQLGEEPGESHPLTVLDAFSTNRYDVFWKRKEGTLLGATPRRTGSNWRVLDDSRGAVLMTRMREGSVFCVVGDAGGFGHDFTRIKEHTFKDTGGIGWISQQWDHWPIGWLNSQAHEVDTESLKNYPNHFSPSGMDLFALKNEEVNGRIFYCLLGVGTEDEAVRLVARTWLESKGTNVANSKTVARLSKTFR